MPMLGVGDGVGAGVAVGAGPGVLDTAGVLVLFSAAKVALFRSVRDSAESLSPVPFSLHAVKEIIRIIVNTSETIAKRNFSHLTLRTLIPSTFYCKKPQFFAIPVSGVETNKKAAKSAALQAKNTMQQIVIYCTNYHLLTK